MYLVSLDPGVTTGVCIVPSDRDPWKFEVMQIGPEEHHSNLLHLLAAWRPQVIVCESFENRANEAAILMSGEYIGVVKAYAQDSRRCHLVLQSASTGKAFWTDDKLKRYEAFAVGMKHARDATKHYFYYRTFTLKDQRLLKGDIGAHLSVRPSIAV